MPPYTIRAWHLACVVGLLLSHFPPLGVRFFLRERLRRAGRGGGPPPRLLAWLLAGSLALLLSGSQAPWLSSALSLSLSLVLPGAWCVNWLSLVQATCVCGSGVALLPTQKPPFPLLSAPIAVLEAKKIFACGATWGLRPQTPPLPVLKPKFRCVRFVEAFWGFI